MSDTMFDQPQAEHHWLDTLVGRWRVESDCQMGPDQPSEQFESQLTVRSLGGLWVVLEGGGQSPESGEWSSIMTIGYDPNKKQYVATFVASMMTHLWQYAGSIDSSGRKLTLETVGPNCSTGGTAPYEDSIEIVDDDHWILSSQIHGDDGQWHKFMTAHHHRCG